MKNFGSKKKGYIFAPQITETWSVRLGVRTQDFHSCNTSSILVRTTLSKIKLSNGK